MADINLTLSIITLYVNALIKRYVRVDQKTGPNYVVYKNAL